VLDGGNDNAADRLTGGPGDDTFVNRAGDLFVDLGADGNDQSRNP